MPAPEAVIVATARSPIGRAAKGSLVDVRPDDLAAGIVRAVLDKVPALDPHEIDDLLLGCGLPGGEQGFNMARVVAVSLGYDEEGAGITYERSAKGRRLKATIPVSKLYEPKIGRPHKITIYAYRKGAHALKRTISFEPCL